MIGRTLVYSIPSPGLRTYVVYYSPSLQPPLHIYICGIGSRGSSQTSTKIKTYLKITTVRNYKVDPTIYIYNIQKPIVSDLSGQLKCTRETSECDSSIHQVQVHSLAIPVFLNLGLQRGKRNNIFTCFFMLCIKSSNQPRRDIFLQPLLSEILSPQYQLLG